MENEAQVQHEHVSGGLVPSRCLLLLASEEAGIRCARRPTLPGRNECCEGRREYSLFSGLVIDV